ncbi:MAG TPA: ArsR family transcriptional regulator [Candidatus Bathyarchaeia archaeon]
MIRVERLCDLFFEFSNEDRLRILYKLMESPSTVTCLSRDLNLTTQETSRHLSRLGEIGLTVKDPNGDHSLTPYGELGLAQIRGFRFTCSHGEYLKWHRVTVLPSEFVARIGELEKCVYTDDIMVLFHRIEQMIKEAEEYVLRLTDRYIITVVPTWEEALKRRVEFRLLDPKDMVVPPEFNRGPVLSDALRTRQFVNHSLASVDVFLALSEKEVAGICFPDSGGRMDYRGFHSGDPEVHGWAKDLFEHYWAKSKAKPIP